LVTRCKTKMVGSGLSTFQLPADFDSPPSDEQQIVIVFEESPGWQFNGFKSLSLASIQEVPCWKALLSEVRLENTPEPCPPYLCIACHDPFPRRTKHFSDEGKREYLAEKWTKSLKCRDCKAARFASSRCEQCSVAVASRQVCGNCKGVFYCSRECQKANRPLHKKACIKPNASIVMKDLASRVFCSDLVLPIMTFLVGSGSPAHAHSLLALMKLSGTSKAIRDKLRSVSLWTYLDITVDLSTSEDFSMRKDGRRKLEDWSWPPLRSHPTKVLSSLLVFGGGSRITALSLQLPVLEDDSLALLAASCPLLVRVELSTTSVNQCRFASAKGLAHFFRTVSPLTHLRVDSDMCALELLPESVMNVIESRAFPLQALSIVLSSRTVEYLPRLCGSVTALEWKVFDRYDENDNVDSIDHFSQAMGTLTSDPFKMLLILRLPDCNALEDSHLIMIAKGMPALRELYIGLFNANPILTDRGIQSLTHCKYLKVLDIYARASITLEGLLTVLRSQQPHPLRELYIGDTHICAGRALLPKLRELLHYAPDLLVLHYSDEEFPQAFGADKIKVSRKMHPLMVEYPQIFLMHPTVGIVDFLDKRSPEYKTLRMTREQVEKKRSGNYSGCLRVCNFANERWI